jgi:hypothetical protein
MSTAITHQPRHRLGRQIAMAAAATAVVAGGATALGFSLSQNDATSPTAPGASSLASPDCRASDCGSRGRIGLGDFSSPNKGGHLTSPKGGHAMAGLL